MQGAAQHNYVPIGTVRLTKDGYLERKVTDDPNIYPARRWIALHRLLWEASHGPIPPGHIVIFKAGQKTAIEADLTIDRLECISRGENAKRNHPRSKSPELAKLVQLKGAITRQVNRLIKESQP
ncbi:HNH endonuclease signature motif containing protein [Comamonas sp. SY3]|uniref:HNH endonuclease signature motif containing protein n=1 Tax=Comamonas sp. SY3 TaxID=3243601 RepID=UPI00359382D6